MTPTQRNRKSISLVLASGTAVAVVLGLTWVATHRDDGTASSSTAQDPFASGHAQKVGALSPDALKLERLYPEEFSTSGSAAPFAAALPPIANTFRATEGSSTGFRAANELTGSTTGIAAGVQGGTEGAKTGTSGTEVANGAAEGSGSGQSAQSDSQATDSAKGKAEPNCFRVAYKQAAEGQDDEASLRKKSLIRLDRSDFNPKTVCVRVAGEPVTFEVAKTSPQDLLIAPVTSTNDAITVTYCVGEAKCHDPCKIADKKKDTFLSAIGAAEGDENDPDAGRWEAGAQGDAEQFKKLNDSLDPALKREIARLDAPKRKKGEKNYFEGWTHEKEVPACL